MIDPYDRLEHIFLDGGCDLSPQAIHTEYVEHIMGLMRDNAKGDMDEVCDGCNLRDIIDAGDLHEFSAKRTQDRMAKYATQFHDEEVTNILDAFNAGSMTSTEMDVRCSILRVLLDSWTTVDL